MNLLAGAGDQHSLSKKYLYTIFRCKHHNNCIFLCLEMEGAMTVTLKKGIKFFDKIRLHALKIILNYM